MDKMDKFEIKTDLALERRESYSGTNVEIDGVGIWEKEYKGVKTTTVDIFTKEGAKLMGKPLGKYITLEMNSDMLYDESKNIISVLSKEIKKLIPKDTDGPILVVGLGNREVTPDALGPQVAGELNISRHLIDNGGICAVVPGVMAQSGMESAEIVKGIVEEIDVKCVIAIDSLAARSVKRLCNTIQLTDTGITPGSGVGNYRSGLNIDTINVPVIAIGVPMVVDAATIVLDTMDALIKVLDENSKTDGFVKIISNFHNEDKYQLVKELLEPQIGTLYVTPKDIDENVVIMSKIISASINKATNGNNIKTF